MTVSTRPIPQQVSRRHLENGFRPRTRSIREILATPPRKLQHGQRWGGWRLNARNLTLEFWEEGRGGWSYYIDLEMVSDAASLLDWIFQFRGRGTPQVMSDLLDAINEIFRPQAHLCSFGVNKTLRPTEFLRERLAGGE